MWESPAALWRRLKLGREEYLQRLVRTLIMPVSAIPPKTVGGLAERLHSG
jgi:hypothetical protein